MILQALYDYYKRKPEIHTCVGYEFEEIHFLIVIDETGKLVDLENLIENNRGRIILVPKAVVRSGKKILPNLLWDNFEYVTGLSKDPKRIKKAKAYNEAFIKRLNSLPPSIKNDKAISALIEFYNSDFQRQLKNHPTFEECVKINCWLTFKLDGELDLISNKQIIKDYQKTIFLNGHYEEDDTKNIRRGICLITGEKKIIKRVHTELRLSGTDKNVKIVAIQKNKGYDSYHKEQGYNAPVSIEAEAYYSAALKHLLNTASNKIEIADTTILFWSEKEPEEINPEEIFPWVISGFNKNEDDPDRGVEVIKKLYDAIYNGKLPRERDKRFYILALAPNAARILVRFWRVISVDEFAANIKQHFDDFEITSNEGNKYLSLYEILTSVSVETKKRNKPNVIFYKGKYYDVMPILSGQLVESIINGKVFPETLLQQCIIRLRAEVSKKDKNVKSIPNVTRTRAAILKAYLNRLFRIQYNNQKEIKMSLDKTNLNEGYLLGRLFAVIERAQFVSNNYKEPNAGVRDRYFSSFSSSPISVLPIIEKLYGHYLKKIKNAQKFYEANLLEENKKEIFDKLKPANIPSHLTLQQQALFSIGYYHQKIELENFNRNKKENLITNNQNN